MSKFKPGMLVMLRGCRITENNGKIVTLVKFVGTPPFLLANGIPWARPGTWWETDTPTMKGDYLNRPIGAAPYCSEANMVPLSDPDTYTEPDPIALTKPTNQPQKALT